MAIAKTLPSKSYVGFGVGFWRSLNALESNIWQNNIRSKTIMNKKDFHGNAKHAPTIADQLTGVVKYGTTANVIDDFNRVWSVETKHSGFILSGINHEGHIPYWSSYKLTLPNIRLFEVLDPTDLPDTVKEKTTIQSVINRHTDADGCRFVDDANMLWEAKKCEHTSGYEIHDLYDNAWLPWVTCRVIGIPGFRMIQTKDQVEAVKSKWKVSLQP